MDTAEGHTMDMDIVGCTFYTKKVSNIIRYNMLPVLKYLDIIAFRSIAGAL